MLRTPAIVFTDLDGTLLDHQSYAYADALPAIHALRDALIPLVFATSKTWSEMRFLQREIGIIGPLIGENGSALYLPKSQFPKAHGDWREHDDFWQVEFARPRSFWCRLLTEFSARHTHLSMFSTMSVDDVCDATGLSREAAERALDRAYTEPVVPLVCDEKAQELGAMIAQHKGCVQRGGRFLTVGDDVSKGHAAGFLIDLIASHTGYIPKSLALGDSGNDLALLDAVDDGVWIRSKHYPPPAGYDLAHCSVTDESGPSAWNKAVFAWLETLDL